MTASAHHPDTHQNHTKFEQSPAAADSVAPNDRRRLAIAFDTWRRRLLDLTKRNRAINYKPQRVATVTIVDERPAEVFKQIVDDEVHFSFAARLPSGTSRQSDGQSPESAISSGNGWGPAPRGANGDGQNARQNGRPDTEPIDERRLDSPLELDASDVPPPAFTPYTASALRPEHRDAVLQCKAAPDALDLSLRPLSEVQRSSLEEQGINTLYLALGFLHYTEAAHSEAVLNAPLVLVPVRLDRKSAQAGYRLSLGEDEPMLNPSLVE